MPLSRDHFRQWLEAEDRDRFSGRLDRLEFVAEEYGEPRCQMLPGGLASALAYEEARWSFVNGQFIGTVLLVQAVIERSLAGVFRWLGQDEVAAGGFSILLHRAREQELISEDEFGQLDRLRRLRNPYAHYRPPLGAGTLERRAVESDAALSAISEADARKALAILFKIMARHPFAVYPSEDGDSG